MKQVCNPCNQKLGNEIDEALARGSIEGWMRFRYGVLFPKETFSAKTQTLRTKIAKGKLKGAIVKLIFLKGEYEPKLALVPQVGFKKFN